MESINSIQQPVPILSSTINPSVQTATKPVRKRKKHLVEVIHIEDGSTYYGTRISYRWSYQFSLSYENINIFNSSEYSFLTKSYQKRLTTVKGAHISYVQRTDINEKILNNRRKRVKKSNNPVNIGEEIYLNLEEPHFEVDVEDKDYFRARTCHYVTDLFPNGYVKFIQQQLRPAMYVNSVDTTQRFDCNSLLVYIDTASMKSRLREHALMVAKCAYSDKQRYVRRFVRDLFWYTMLLYYINWSWGWEIRELDYSKAWNLAMYIIYSFRILEDDDWFPGVTEAYARFLFEKKVYNGLSRGVKHFFAEASSHLRKETRYSFPEGTNKLQKEMYKVNIKTPSKELLSERNKQIKELYIQGKTPVWLANKFHLKPRQIYNIIG